MASELRRVRRCSAGELHLHVVADHADGEGFDVAGNGWAEALAGLDLETAGVERTLDRLAVEPAVRQEREGMGADVRGGIDLAGEIVERDLLLATETPSTSPSPSLAREATVIHLSLSVMRERALPSASCARTSFPSSRDCGASDSCATPGLWQCAMPAVDADRSVHNSRRCLARGSAPKCWPCGAGSPPWGVQRGQMGIWGWLELEYWAPWRWLRRFSVALMKHHPRQPRSLPHRQPANRKRRGLGLPCWASRPRRSGKSTGRSTIRSWFSGATTAACTSAAASAVGA